MSIDVGDIKLDLDAYGKSIFDHYAKEIDRSLYNLYTTTSIPLHFTTTIDTTT
jgi:hypothetical protein